MKSRWDDQEAAQYAGDLAQRVYTSRLLGRDRTLVLHGGGNTSVKIRQTNILGEEEDILYVKGSGWDLETIEAAGFSPVRMARLLGLARLEQLTDARMAAELKSNMIDAGAPAPSVEAILHAILPYRFVDHTHADALIAVTNTADGERRVREIYGDRVVVIPYVMPGFRLARLCAEMFPAEAGPQTVGMVLLNHGLFTFGDTARESYELMIELVDRAEQYLTRQGAQQIALPERAAPPSPARAEVAALRRAVSAMAGTPLIMTIHRDAEVMAFVGRDDLAQIAGQGPATPDHVIRTKRLPLIGRDVAAYGAAYAQYFADNAPSVDQPLTMLDPAPRIILDRDLGMGAIGRTAKDAAIAAEIYRHTMAIILQSTALVGYRALPAHDIFEVEYWDLEQAKLRRAGAPPMFSGEVALVTGAASGIGKACVDALLARGAAVVGLDINPAMPDLYRRDDVLGLCCDVTDEAAVGRTLDAAVGRFGGLDMLILNAGIFPASRRIAELSLAEWDRVQRVNLDANLVLLRQAHPLLKLAPKGGRVAVIGSKNVPAPGPGAAAYSASKAALTQLARVAALEWAADGIRVNILHPNAVFDTGIWTDEVLQQRAAHYKMSVEDYKTNNLLHVEVTSRDVANLAAELCGPLFAKTTAAQIPVDGGNERVV
jgi:rhamnose utilization protein RhaD (predicted bifunctional aldolase and dehydrogenase)/NAD(P)-dependent dehydrogenase (short-subunit alcohol dehydrogenase family)